MVPPDSCRISPVPHYSGYHYLHIAYAYRTFTLFGAAFQAASTSLCFRYRDPTTPEHASMYLLRLLPVRSPLLGKSLLFSSPLCNYKFQFSEFALLKRSIPINQDGLPHSENHGSTLLCSSPLLIAAWHVLHRHCMPRHPPYALVYFNLEWLARTLQNTKQAHELDFFLASKLLQNHSPCGKQPHIQLLFYYYPQYVKEHP